MTPGEAFDIMAEKFGVGDYDEWTATVPYWRWRMGEVAKIRAMMRRRRVSMQELVIAIEYAVAHRKPITESYQIFNLVPDALAEHFANERSHRKHAASVDAETLAAEAMAAGETLWAQRLMAADRSSVAEVAEAYRTRGEA